MVIDSNVVIALLYPLPYSEMATLHMNNLKASEKDLYAPALFEYEVCSAFRKIILHNGLEYKTASISMELIHNLGIQIISPASSLHKAALRWAAKLQHSKAYDAQYLALAEQMRCPLLTADKRLAKAAHAVGATWVECVA